MNIHQYRKTNWATVSHPGAEMSADFPDDAQQRISNANLALQQLTGVGITAFASLAQMAGGNDLVVPSAQNISNVAQAALDAALGADSTATTTAVTNEPAAVPMNPQNVDTLASVEVNGAGDAVVEQDPGKVSGEPSPYLLVRNMYDKDAETDPNWHEDIREEFLDESAKFGKICKIKVEHLKPGGMVYVQFATAEMASSCANALAGRWFDGRQLCVEFVSEGGFPSDAMEVGGD